MTASLEAWQDAGIRHRGDLTASNQMRIGNLTASDENGKLNCFRGDENGKKGGSDQTRTGKHGSSAGISRALELSLI